MKNHLRVALSLAALLGGCAMPEPIPKTCEMGNCSAQGPDGAVTKDMGWRPDGAPPTKVDAPLDTGPTPRPDSASLDGVKLDGVRLDGVKADGVKADGLTFDGPQQKLDVKTLEGMP